MKCLNAQKAKCDAIILPIQIIILGKVDLFDDIHYKKDIYMNFVNI